MQNGVQSKPAAMGANITTTPQTNPEAERKLGFPDALSRAVRDHMFVPKVALSSNA